MSMTAYDTLVSVALSFSFFARARTHTERESRRRVGNAHGAPRPPHGRVVTRAAREGDRERKTRHTPVGRKGIRFLFRNPAAEPHTIRALVRVFVGVTQNDLETPSGDPGRVFFSV